MDVKLEELKALLEQEIGNLTEYGKERIIILQTEILHQDVNGE
ncbi:hypothetical protein [Lottiidibacillus patelloidae]|nr:hypothetical protein [Lottiidibacillus patelloidae]